MDDIKEAIKLAIDNKACITAILAASYPNGALADGVNRDITVNLGAEESKRVYEAILESLDG